MAWRAEDLMHIALFDDGGRLSSRIATRPPSLRTMARSWVMNSSAMPRRSLQIGEQGEDLRLDGDVQGGGGFVGDQDVGLERQRHGDHHPLTLAAGQFVRQSGEAAIGFRQTDQAEKFQHPRALGRAGNAGVDFEHFANLLLDIVEGIERGHGFLEHHADAVAADARAASPSGAPTISVPLNRMLPAGWDAGG